MAELSPWVEANWFNVIQTAGILGGLLMGAAAANREARASEIENLLTISEHHRAVWSELLKSPELQRILQSDADLVSKPLTPKEIEWTNLIILQFLKSWRIAKTGGLLTLNELAADVWGFFSLPLPHAVWEKTKKYRNKDFVGFIRRAIERRGRF